MRSTLITAALAASLALPASAQWMHSSSGGAFDGAPLHMAFVSSGAYALGLRCQENTVTSVLMTTPERAERSAVDALNALAPVILLRVDDGAVFEAPAQATLHSEDGTVLVMGEAPDGFGDAVIEAGSTISAALRVAGELFYETAFTAAGSTASVQAMYDGCWPK